MSTVPSAFGHLPGQLHAVGVALLHAVEPAAALGRHRRGVEHDVADPVGPRPASTPGHDQATRRVGHDHDRVGQVGGLDVGQHRGDLVVDRQRAEVGRLAVAAGQVDGQRRLVEQAAAAGPRSGPTSRPRG